MLPVWTLALPAAFLATAAAAAAPRERLAPNPALELRAAVRVFPERRAPRSALELRATVRGLPERRASAAHVLRELPTPVEAPGVYARVSRWVDEVARPAADGTPRLVVVTVPGGLGLAWARRW